MLFLLLGRFRNSSMYSSQEGLFLLVTVCTVLLVSSHGQQQTWEECSKHLFTRDHVDCGDIEDYVKCSIRALGPNTDGVEPMAEQINKNIREGQNQAFLDCDLDAHQLMEEVRREGGGPMPEPESRGSRREDDDDDRHHTSSSSSSMNTPQLPNSFGGHNAQHDACVEKFMEDVVRVKDRDQICEPTKELMLCGFKAVGIDLTDHMSRYEKDYVEQMMHRELRMLGVKCDFTLDSLIQEEKASFSYTTKILTPMVGLLFMVMFLSIVGRVYIVRKRRMGMMRGRAGPYTVSNSNTLHTSGASPGVCYPSHPTGPQQHLPAYEAPYNPEYANAHAGPPAYASAPPTYELAMESKNASMEGGVNPIYDTVQEKH